jgi:hypothetical protein
MMPTRLHSTIRNFMPGALLLLSLVCGHNASAQAPVPSADPSTSAGGPLSIQAVDPANAAVPTASITLKNDDTGSQFSVSTDAEGRARVPKLPFGKYTVTGTVAGFSPERVKIAHLPGSANTVVLRFGGPVPSGDPGAPSGSAASPQLMVEERSFDDEVALQTWINDVTTRHLQLSTVIPLADKRSVFVLVPGAAAATEAVLVNRSLDPADLKTRISLHQDSTLLGIHRLNASSYVMVLRRTR